MMGLLSLIYTKQGSRRLQLVPIFGAPRSASNRMIDKRMAAGMTGLPDRDACRFQTPPAGL
jgi:hypothetical protein